MYSRADLLRILHLTPRQLANWERAGLIAASTAYTFADLLKIKKVRDLCAMLLRARRHREISGSHAETGFRHGAILLVEAGASSTSKHRIAFRHQGRLLEPIAGQFLMDFSTREKIVTTTPIPAPKHSAR